VDDTELDEVYLEDDEIDPGFGQPAPKPVAEPAPAGKPGTLSLNVIEAPPPSAGPAPPPSAGPAPPPIAPAGPPPSVPVEPSNNPPPPA
jgi:hypothetical protein